MICSSEAASAPPRCRHNGCSQQVHLRREITMATMRAAVFGGKGKISIREVARPEPGPGEALVRTTVTTICGTDVHILKGEYPVREGLIVGHEPVGVIEAVGLGVTGYANGDR